MRLNLDLAFAPSTLFLFGLSGAGKSFVGDLIGEQTGWFVYHADDDITNEMRLALKEKRPFTQEMRDRYFPIIVEKILSLQQHHEHLVITQGVYKQQHRDFLLNKIPNMEMICIDAPDQLISRRLTKRSEGIKSASAAALRLDFEPPAKDTKIIHNDASSERIINQLNQYFRER